MPQLQLPFFPQGMTLINANIGFHREGDMITYFHGHLPVFRHEVDDQRSFRMITSQLYINGSVKQSEICRAFGIAAINVKRGVKLYREKGIAGFYQEPRRRGAAVLTPPVVVEIQGYLDQGEELTEIASRMGLLADTLRKAVQAGKLHKPKKKRNDQRGTTREHEKYEKCGRCRDTDRHGSHQYFWPYRYQPLWHGNVAANLHSLSGRACRWCASGPACTSFDGIASTLGEIF